LDAKLRIITSNLALQQEQLELDGFKTDMTQLTEYIKTLKQIDFGNLITDQKQLIQNCDISTENINSNYKRIRRHGIIIDGNFGKITTQLSNKNFKLELKKRYALPESALSE